MNEASTKPLDIMVWVSARHYPTSEAFITEAERIGACRKFGGRLPKDVEVGKSRVFLAFDYRDPNTRKAKKDRLNGQLFAYFTIDSILVVGDVSQLLEKEGIDIQHLSFLEAQSFERRGCGTLMMGGTYFVSDSDMKKLQKHADSVLGSISELQPQLLFRRKRARGFTYVNGDAILSYEKPAKWFDIKAARHANWLARREASKAERKQLREAGLPMPVREKLVKRETYTATILYLLGFSSPILYDELIDKAIERNPPISTWPRWRYQTIIRMMARDGKVEVLKQAGEKTVCLQEY